MLWEAPEYVEVAVAARARSAISSSLADSLAPRVRRRIEQHVQVC